MKRNSKGVAEIILLLWVAAAIVGTLVFSGPIKGLIGQAKDIQKSSHKVSHTRQLFYKDDKGRERPVPEIYTEEWQNTSSAQPRRSFTQKLFDLFGPWAVVLGLLCLLVPGFGTWLVARFWQMKKAMGQTVEGVEKWLVAASDAEKKALLDNLSKAMDDSSKSIVAKIKNS